MTILVQQIRPIHIYDKYRFMSNRKCMKNHSETSSLKITNDKDLYKNPKSLKVYSILSDRINFLNRGYMPEISRTFTPDSSNTHVFKFIAVDNGPDKEDAVSFSGS